MLERVQKNSKKFPLPILLYDDQCTLCTRFKQGLERMPGSSDFLMESVHNEELYVEYPELVKDRCLEVVHIIDEKGKIIIGEQAMTNLIERFPGVKKIAWLLDSDVGKKTMSSFYKAVNKCREQLQKRCHSCK